MRCHKSNHFTGDVTNCEAYLSRDQQKHIMPFKSPMNVLTNFWTEDLRVDNQVFKSGEHCYQWYFCIEHNDPDRAEQVFNADSPTSAKRIAQEIKVTITEEWNNNKLNIMRRILGLKLLAVPSLHIISSIQDQSTLWKLPKSTFFGAGLSPHMCRTSDPSFYTAQNMLGKLLMEPNTNRRTMSKQEMLQSLPSGQGSLRLPPLMFMPLPLSQPPPPHPLLL